MTASSLSYASPAATKQYFEKLKSVGIEVKFAPFGATDLSASKIGFGGYRVHEFDPDHREALRIALTGGCNLIDTSTNYTDGGSERLIGEVLSELMAKGDIRRDEIIIVSKVGYVQGANLRETKARAFPYPDMVEYQADCWHNISPEFLSDQITKSLERLKIETIDILLLHNPEYYMKNSGNRDVYYARIEKAFRYLETEQQRGRISYYGVSSNTFPEPESRSDFTSLQKIVEIAKQIGPKNHFAAIQFPFNLFEAGGALNKNNKLKSALDFAIENKLGVLTNRPFNAYAKGRLVRLTSFPTHDQVEVKGELHTTLGRAIELEKRHPSFPKSPQGLQWAHALRERLAEIDDLLIWKDVLFQQILPSVRQAVSRLLPEQEAWGNEYISVIQTLAKLVTWDLENLAEKKSLLLSGQMNTLAPDLSSSATLSQKMLRLYTGIPAIGSVLVGMRTPDYVRDAMAAGAPLPEQKSIETLTRMQRHKS